MALGETLKEFGVKLTLMFDKKKAEEAKKAIVEVGSDMRALAVQVGTATAALLGLAAVSSHNSRELQQNSDMLGINVERLQELEYAARVAAGVSRDELMGALEGVSSTLDKARHSDVMAAQSLIRLGVPLSMVTDRTVTADQVMGQLAESFKNIQDPMAKARLATEVFGGAGAKLLPLLNKGAAGMAAMGMEARSMGLILSKTSIDQGAEFDRQFTKIWLVLKNVTYLVGNELIKYLRPMVTEFQRWITVNRQFIAQGIAGVVKEIGTYLGIVFKVIKFVVDRFQALTNALGGTAKGAHYLALALGVITGVKILAGIGTLVQSFRAVSLIFTGLNIQAAVIGAALLAIILIVQDLFSDDSIIKEWAGSFKDSIANGIESVTNLLTGKFPNAMKFITGVFNVFKDVLDDVVGGFESLFGWIGQIADKTVDLVSALMQFIHLKEALTEVGGGLKKVGGWISDGASAVGSAIGSGAGAAGDWLTAHSSAGQQKAQAFQSVTPPPGTVYGPQNNPAASAAPQNSFSTQVTVNVPPGTSAAAAANMVTEGTDSAFQKMLNKARSQAIGGRAY